MYILNIASAIKKMTVNELLDFIFENYYWICKRKRSLFYKLLDLQLFVTKVTEKILDPSNANKYYNSYLKKKNTKSVKQSKITTHQLKAIERPKIVDINLVIIEL